MVSRLRPLEVGLVFEDRPYRLGQTIDITVELIPNRDVEVREGRIDLECEASYTETFTVTAPDRKALRGLGLAGAGRVGGVPATPMDRRQVTEDRRDTFLHSTVVFLQEETVRAATTGRYRARLAIDGQPPRGSRGSAHRGRADMAWSLVARVDVAQARDVTARYPVQVAGVGEDDSGRASKLTPEQRRENARKAAEARWAKARARSQE